MKQWKITQSVNLAHNSAGVLAWPHALMVEGDKNAHVWEITIQDGRSTPDLTGASVNVYFNRADNTTVLVKGSVSRNVASVVLDQQCYAVAGPMIGIFRIATATGTTLTVSIMRFTVGKGPYAQIIDPGEAIPNLDDFLAHLEAMDTITQTALKIQDTNGGPVDLILVQGDPGYTPVRGKDYWTEDDQEAITEKVSNQLSLEMADEIGDRVTSTILAKAKESGEFDGEDGHTPIKGTDYWTGADQEDIVQQVIKALGTPVYGTVNENKVVTLSGILVPGTYIFVFENEDGSTTEIGTYRKVYAFTNLFVVNTCQLNKRTNSSGAISNNVGGFVTDYIDIGMVLANGGENLLHYKNLYFHCDAWTGAYDLYSYIAYYDENKAYLGNTSYRNVPDEQTADGDYVKVLDATKTTARYIRISAIPYPNTAAETVELTSIAQLAECKLALNEPIMD